MKKSARKILSLVLSLVLICALAATAFAARTASAEEGFKHCDVFATASIGQYSTGIVFDADTDGTEIVFSGSVACEYTYYPRDYSNVNDFETDSFTKAFNDIHMNYTYGKYYSATDIAVMRNASYDVNVIIDTNSGSYVFEPSTLSVSYTNS